jgi:flotillin
MLMEVLPKIAHEVSAPIASIDKLTVISADGAAALPKQVSDNLLQTTELIRSTTGVDLTRLLERVAAAPALSGGSAEQPTTGSPERGRLG